MAMIQKAGAILGNEFLEHDNFIQTIVTNLEQKDNDRPWLYALLNQLKSLENAKGKKLYEGWQRIQLSFAKLNNQSIIPTSLLVVENLEGTNNITTFYADESKTLTQTGRLSRKAQVDKISQEFKEQYFQGLFDEHFQSFYDQLQVKEKENNFLTSIFGKKAAEGQGPQLKGHIADMYLQHALIKHNPLPDENLTKNTDVFREEGGEENVRELLMQSKNTYGWQTGGDFIMTDAQGKVILNIQLKTSYKKYRSQMITSDRVQRFIKDMYEMLNLMLQEKKIDYQNIAEQYYNSIATTAWVPEQQLDNIIEEKIIKSLKTK